VTDQYPERLRRRGAFAPPGQSAAARSAPSPATPAAPAGAGCGESSGPNVTPGGAGPPRSRPKGQRRPLDPWKAAFILLALAGIVAGVAWALLGSRFFVVRSVRVTGLHRVSRAQVITAAAIPAGLPLIRVNDAAVGRRVDAITQVESAHVTRSWPDGIVINITERTPVIAISDAGKYDLADRFGIVVVSASQRPPRLPLFTTSGAIRGSPAVAAAVAVLHELPAPMPGRVMSITAPTADDVTLHLTGGVTVVWGSPAGAAAKQRILAVLMRTHARYYDVSAPSVATTH
jgi:cell division protein FtsQ